MQLLTIQHYNEQIMGLYYIKKKPSHELQKQEGEVNSFNR